MIVLKQLEELLIARAGDWQERGNNTPNLVKSERYIERAVIYKELAAMISMVEEKT